MIFREGQGVVEGVQQGGKGDAPVVLTKDRGGTTVEALCNQVSYNTEALFCP